MKKAAWAACWLAPLAALFWLHWYGFRSWFWADDFAWLGLHNLVHDRASLLKSLFEPAAQGTIRPWSERGFFLLFFHFFGTDALPYHALAFATQVCNLILLMWIMRKIGAPLLSASMAAVLWTANAALVLPLAWSADYNQTLCAFFLLAAFALYLSGHFWLQAWVFVLGFGALEINVVYPAILLLWLLLNRRSPRPAFPLIAISIVYFGLHRYFTAAVDSSPTYTLHFDRSVFVTLYRYCKLVWVPTGWYGMTGSHPWVGSAAIVVLFLATLWQLRSADIPARFFFGWFAITLAPVLPLSQHLSDYYVAIPSLGLAAGIGLLSRRSRGFAIALAALYLYFQIPVTRLFAYQHFESSQRIRNVVLGVAHARELHPGKAILVAGVSTELYITGFSDSPFQALNLPHVYLSPDTNLSIPSNYAQPSEFILPPGPTLHALAADQLEVYQAGGPELRNITADYQKTAPDKFFDTAPKKLDVGDPLLAYLLGPTWYSVEDNYRWMPESAAFRIGGPRTSKEKLVITGYCPPWLLRQGPLKLRISIDGNILVETVVNSEGTFTRTFGLPLTSIGNESMELILRAERTVIVGKDTRQTSFAFGTFEVRQP